MKTMNFLLHCKPLSFVRAYPKIKRDRVGAWDRPTLCVIYFNTSKFNYYNFIKLRVFYMCASNYAIICFHRSFQRKLLFH